LKKKTNGGGPIESWEGDDAEALALRTGDILTSSYGESCMLKRLNSGKINTERLQEGCAGKRCFEARKKGKTMLTSRKARIWSGFLGKIAVQHRPRGEVGFREGGGLKNKGKKTAETKGVNQ